jgi:hypothetical protein
MYSCLDKGKNIQRNNEYMNKAIKEGLGAATLYIPTTEICAYNPINIATILNRYSPCVHFPLHLAHIYGCEEVHAWRRLIVLSAQCGQRRYGSIICVVGLTIELTRLGRRPGVCRTPRATSKRRDDGPNRVQRFVMGTAITSEHYLTVR